jgi:uncharacterized heparinase superfamily protein
VIPLALTWRSVRHTRPSQLWARLHLQVKRKVISRVNARTSLVSSRTRWPDSVEITETGQPPRLREEVPLPIFGRREHLCVQEAGESFAAFLNLKHPIKCPVDWHPHAWERGTRLETLNLHYMEYLEAVDDSTFAAVVEDWIRSNPPYRSCYWLDSWNSYALSIRIVVWMQQYALRQESFSIRTRRLLLASLLAQIRFLVKNLELDIPGNHIIKNIKAILWAGHFFQGLEADHWRKLGTELLLKHVSEQILDDGLHFERSPAYHAQVFADLLECYSILSPSDTRSRLAGALAAMAQGLCDLTHPDDMISLFNDGGLHMAYQPSQCLTACDRLTGDSAVPRAQFAYPTAGYYGLRKGDSFLAVDCGAIAPDHLPAHGHGDILSFEWDVQGHRLIVDAGVFEYHEGQWRDYSRSTRAHNTVTLDDADQCEFWKSFRVGRRAVVSCDRVAFRTGWIHVTGHHDGFARLSGRPMHHRSLSSDTATVDVTDRILGGNRQAVRARLLLHPECTVLPVEGVWIISRRHVTVRVTAACPVRVEEAWWMPDFGVMQKTSQIVFEYGRAPCTGGFKLHAL